MLHTAIHHISILAICILIFAIGLYFVVGKLRKPYGPSKPATRATTGSTPSSGSTGGSTGGRPQAPQITKPE